jgi:hypothetical protein
VVRFVFSFIGVQDAGEEPLRILIAIAAIATLSAAAPATAQYAPHEYNRGYHDCLAGRYDDEEHSHVYRQGCRAAERERGGDAEGMGERPRYPRPEPVPAPVASLVGIPKVVGMNSMQAVAAMASRGYRNVGTSIVGGGVFGIYFNPATRECVQLANARGQVVDAREIGSHPQCR